MARKINLVNGLRFLTLIAGISFINLACEAAQQVPVPGKQDSCKKDCASPNCKQPCGACCEKKWSQDQERKKHCHVNCQKHGKQ